MDDDELRLFIQTAATKLSALQYVLEIILANQFAEVGADACESVGKRVADHARSAPSNLSPGSGPIDVDQAKLRTNAIADELERIFSLASDPYTQSGSRINSGPFYQ